MILLLDTSTPTCKLTLVEDADTYEYEWFADRQLARGLLEFIVGKLAEHSLEVKALEGMGLMRGPGSFTGLRIGATVLNTIAAFEHVPIVGVTGENWQEHALELLRSGQNDQIVTPEYGRDARITKPRK
jgi:tRNA threonylcarbamoyladenosine biosynthesis protein TsaB